MVGHHGICLLWDKFKTTESSKRAGSNKGGGKWAHSETSSLEPTLKSFGYFSVIFFSLSSTVNFMENRLNYFREMRNLNNVIFMLYNKSTLTAFPIISISDWLMCPHSFIACSLTGARAFYKATKVGYKLLIRSIPSVSDDRASRTHVSARFKQIIKTKNVVFHNSFSASHECEREVLHGLR